MSFLIFGDFALPDVDCINIDELVKLTDNKTVIANLEGPIIVTEDIGVVDHLKYNLYTSINSVSTLNRLNIKYLSVANNHFADFKQPIDNTIKVLNKESINVFGTKSKSNAVIKQDDEAICIWGTVSFLTGSLKTKYVQLNEFKPVQLLKELRKFKLSNPDIYLVVYVHWGYELANYPEPADREWARAAIDVGVDAIIGHHSHVVQGIEKYKNGLIVYSLGNFVLPQTEFLDRLLSYKSEKVNRQIGVELDLLENKFYKHEIVYSKKESKLIYKGKFDLFEEEILPFKGYSNAEYTNWFKLHNHNKGGLYPTFSSYFRFFNVEFKLFKYYLLAIRNFRRLLIILRVHTPYNWK